MKLFLILLLALVPSAPSGSEFAARLYEQGQQAEKAGQPAAAHTSYERVLERQANHLGALAALVRLDRAAGHTDEALWRADLFLQTWRYAKTKPPELAKTREEIARYAQEADPLRKRLDALRREHVSRLLKLANEQMDHLAWHGARAILEEALATDPEHPELAAGLDRIKKEGGNELAVADETGGADPLEGVTPEWVAANDPLHVEWDKAWELETEHYHIRTDAGYRVLKTVARAMEQVQVFYRLFHQYKVKGEKIPVADVWLFKDRAEFKDLGHPPTDWAAGYWNGSQVITYDQREKNQGSLRDTLEVLFHEASHQFTTLAGGTGVPAWLNEGMASFFEGTQLLSNGKLDWNLVVPGRLYPLAEDLRKPDRHKLADVIQGKVEDYRVNYPWGWGICYYLYNAEDASGRLLYRPLMAEYFGKYNGEQHLERFTEFFVTRAKVPGITTLEQWESAFIAYVKDLEALDKGQIDAARRYEERADGQVARGDHARAVELYGRALERDPDHPDLLWKLAAELEQVKEGDRAAGILRRWLFVTSGDGSQALSAAELTKRTQVLARIQKLDTSAKRLAEMRERFYEGALALAEEYKKLALPRLALLVARGPAVGQPPSEAARKLYFALQDEFHVSLERWRLLFDEQTLAGFYGGGEQDFEVKDGVILAHIGSAGAAARGQAPSTGNGSAPKEPKSASFAFQRLFIDERPSGDWSLQAEIQLAPGCRMAGLCFGKKQDGDIHGLALLPEGYLDLARFGTDGQPLLRTKLDAPLTGWHKLGLEVAGTALHVSLDGVERLSYEFSSRGELKGDFGLLAGDGTSSFREIKLLDFDPRLPRRTKLGFRRPLADRTAAKLERAPAGRASYLNEFPPLVRVDRWIGTPPADGDLDRLRDWPVVLVFWSTYQEKQVPLLPGLLALREKLAAFEIPFLLISDDEPAQLEAYLAANPLPFPIGLNHVHQANADYAIAKVGLPHAKLIDLEGRVSWEGNPDWQAEYGCLIEGPITELAQRAHLAELVAARTTLKAAEEAFAAGDFKAAWQRAGEVAKLDVVHPRTLAAKQLLERIEIEARARLTQAEGFSQTGRPLQSVRGLRELGALFAECAAAREAAPLLEKRLKSSAYQNAKSLENRLKQAELHLKAASSDKARATLDALSAKLDATSDAWIAERVRWLSERLQPGRDPKLLLGEYATQFPGAVE